MKAAILLNGEVPVFPLSKILEDRYIVCADGAYDWANEKNIKIDLLIGDFDSIKQNPDESIKTLRFKPNKDCTDGQLCLDYLIQNSYDDIVFLGGGGKRDDHFFCGLQLLYRALKNNVFCVFYINSCEIYITDKLFKKTLLKESVLSLVPLFESAHIIETKGLKYKLKDRTIFAHESLGISNIVIKESVEIKVKDGVVLIFVVM